MSERNVSLRFITPNKNPEQMSQGPHRDLGEGELVRRHVLQNQPRDRKPQETTVEKYLIQSIEARGGIISSLIGAWHTQTNLTKIESALRSERDRSVHKVELGGSGTIALLLFFFFFFLALSKALFSLGRRICSVSFGPK